MSTFPLNPPVIGVSDGQKALIYCQFVVRLFQVRNTVPKEAWANMNKNDTSYCVTKPLYGDQWWMNAVQYLSKRDRIPRKMFARSLKMHCSGS